MKEWQTYTSSVSFSFSIHDSWTETLTGTCFLMNLMGSEKHEFNKIEKLHLARQVIVSCSQLVEMIFHDVVELFIKENSKKLCKCCLIRIETDMNNQIGIEKAMRTWPSMLIDEDEKFNFGLGVFQSYKTLKDCRNKTIHAGVNNYDFLFVNVAYNTALKASEEIWISFFPKRRFKYFDWVEKMPPTTDDLFHKYGHVFLEKKG